MNVSNRPPASDARLRAMKSSIRNFLYPMSRREMQGVLDDAIKYSGKDRIRCIEDYICEVTAEEGICISCGDWADGNGDLCCDCEL